METKGGNVSAEGGEGAFRSGEEEAAASVNNLKGHGGIKH